MKKDGINKKSLHQKPHASASFQGVPVARLFSAGLGLVIKVPHCCYVLLSAPILPSFFGGNFKIKGEDGGRQQHIATVRDFYHQT